MVNGSSVFLTTGSTTGTIEGNYTQQAGAQLMIALGANALQVTGNASINGGVRVHGFVSGYVPQNGSRQDLVHAAGGLSGTFSSRPPPAACRACRCCRAAMATTATTPG
jgi:outer membrane autotransporter protein